MATTTSDPAEPLLAATARVPLTRAGVLALCLAALEAEREEVPAEVGDAAAGEAGEDVDALGSEGDGEDEDAARGEGEGHEGAVRSLAACPDRARALAEIAQRAAALDRGRAPEAPPAARARRAHRRPRGGGEAPAPEDRRVEVDHRRGPPGAAGATRADP